MSEASPATPKLSGSGIVLFFTTTAETRLSGLVTEAGYEKPTKERPTITSKELADGTTIAIERINATTVSVAYTGPMVDIGQARFVVDMIYHDLSIAGLVAAPDPAISNR